MSTTAVAVINALLTNTEFNTLVASLKSKRDEIASYQSSIAMYQTALTATQANLATAQADELALQLQVQTAGADIIATTLA